MAIEKTIELNLDATEAQKALNKFGGTLEDVYGEGVQPLNFAIGELEDRLYEMAAAGDTSSRQFMEMSEEVARMKKVIIDTDMVLDGMSQTAAQKVGGSIGGLASGFELAQGAMATFGVESSQVEEALLRVQSAMAISQGFQGIREAIPSFRGLASSAKLFGTNAIKAFKGMTTASKAFMATGLGLIISGIALAVANWDSLTKAIGFNNDAVSDATKNRKTLLEVETKALENAAQELSDLDQLQVKLRNTNISREEKNEAVRAMQEQYPDLLYNMDVENMVLEDLQVSIDKYIKLANLKAKVEASQALRTEEYKKQLEEQVKAQNLENLSHEQKLALAYKDASVLDIVTGRVAENIDAEKLSNDIKKATIENLKKSHKESQKTINFLDEQILKTQEQISQVESELGLDKKKRQSTLETRGVQEKAERDRLKALEEEKRLNEEIARIRENEILRQIQEEEELSEVIRRSKLDAQTLEIEDLNTHYFNLIERAKQYGLDTQALEEEQNEKIKEINDKYQAEKDAKAEEQKDQDDADRAERLQKDLDLENAKFEAAALTLEGISGLVSAFAGESEAQQRRAFNIQKAINISQAVMDTYKGANAIFANAAMNPSTVLFPAQPFIMAGAAITAGLANVATIAKQKFDGGGSPSSGGGSATSNVPNAPTQAPTFNVVGNTGVNQLAETLGSSPMQAYVVAGDVTTAQSLERNKIEQSTL